MGLVEAELLLLVDAFHVALLVRRQLVIVLRMVNLNATLDVAAIGLAVTRLSGSIELVRHLGLVVAVGDVLLVLLHLGFCVFKCLTHALLELLPEIGE